MFRSIHRRTLTALVLATSVALNVPAAEARGSAAGEPHETVSLLGEAWSWLVGLLADSRPGHGMDGDHRCTVDPNGVCIPGSGAGDGGSGHGH
jgi:hypothetical protein